jgi:KaiC/GvpD/RAD55 family RecA-like ATPase
MASKDYSVDMQKLFIEIMLADAQCFVRVQNIFDPANFDRSLKPVATLLQDYSEKYSALPNTDQVKAETGTELQKIDTVEDSMTAWFMDEFENFTRHEALKRVILQSADLIEKGEYDPIEKLIKDAVQISLTKDLGMDFWSDPSGMMSRYFDNGGQVSTGWPQLDNILYGGMSRGELNIFAGGSGSGKSLVMMNIALNWVQMGLHGVYVTLELSEELTGLRTAAMLTNSSTKDIRKDKDTAALKIKMVGKKSGSYQVKYMPAQSNINDIRSFIKEYQIKTGNKIDFMMIDYLDLLMPVSAKVSPNDLFVKDKYVSEELRNLAKELGVLMITASQLNRSAVEEVEFDHSHISGGISKINTADNVFGIFTSRAMKERGRYQIQCMKSRSSTGVGMKIDLEYNIDTMRITDSGADDDSTQYKRPASTMLDNIRNKSTVNSANSDSESNLPKITADVQSNKLKQMLANLKSN